MKRSPVSLLNVFVTWQTDCCFTFNAFFLSRVDFYFFTLFWT